MAAPRGARARPRWTRVSSRSPSGWPASKRSSTTSPPRSAASPTTSSTTRARSPRSRSASGSSTPSSAGTATTRRPSSPTASGPPSRLERLRGLDERAGPTRGGGRRGCSPTSRPPPRLCPTVRAATAVGDLADGRRRASSSSWVSRRASSRSRSAAGRPAPDEAAVELDGDAVAFDAAGADQVVYRLAPNPGEPARPLARIASGGELSRVALAIKQVLAEADDTPTLVFDEVDTGIGGRSADPVGRSLWALARRHQVLCVTHLPQIAAHADAHFRIAKRERDGRTVTEVERLDREGRIVELAQMLGGEAGGAATLAIGPRAARPRRGVARRGRAAPADGPGRRARDRPRTGRSTTT